MFENVFDHFHKTMRTAEKSGRSVHALRPVRDFDIVGSVCQGCLQIILKACKSGKQLAVVRGIQAAGGNLPEQARSQIPVRAGNLALRLAVCQLRGKGAQGFILTDGLAALGFFVGRPPVNLVKALKLRVFARQVAGQGAAGRGRGADRARQTVNQRVS